MFNPVIILGAGASKDYSQYGNPAPVTDELLHSDFKNSLALNKYKEAADLLTQISYSVLNKQKSFEEALSDIKNDFGALSHVKSQFVALEFYLQQVFQKISLNIQELNNYKTLVQKIKNFNQGKACVVTFNYDTLFESSIGMDFWQTMESYIKNNLKLIKVHGSHDWAYIQHKSLISGYILDRYPSDYDFYTKNPDYLDNIRSSQKDINPYPMAYINKQKDHNDFIKFPAIAIPLLTKSIFICPQAHLRELELALSTADRVLIVGWKAGDKPFLDFMKEHLSKGVSITVVSSSKKSAEEIISNKLSDFLCRAASNGGFSAFVNSDDIRQFFV